VSKPFLSGVLSEEGSPPPSSPPGIFIALNRPSTPLDDLPIKGSFAPDPPVRGLFFATPNLCKVSALLRNKKPPSFYQVGGNFLWRVGIFLQINISQGAGLFIKDRWILRTIWRKSREVFVGYGSRAAGADGERIATDKNIPAIDA
jgi:hypothetical protein